MNDSEVKQERVNGVSQILREMGYAADSDEHFNITEIEKKLQRLFTRVCGEHPQSIDDMRVPLTIEKENALLLSIGFNATDIRQTELADLRNSYDENNYEMLEVYLNTIKVQLRDGCGATFFGGTGSGKTNSMSLCFRYLIRAFYDSFTRTVNIGMRSEFADRLVEMVKEDNYNRRAWYCEVPIFGIDDIYLYTDYRYNLLRWVINERTSKGKGFLTLMTTRLQRHEFDRCRDIYSRMGFGQKFWTSNIDFRQPL